VSVRYKLALRRVPGLGVLPRRVAVSARDIEPATPNVSVVGGPDEGARTERQHSQPTKLQGPTRPVPVSSSAPDLGRDEPG
jgi:hypothetical protein